MNTRSKDEITLRDNEAGLYDTWYLERGVNAVDAEDLTILKKLRIDTSVKTFLDLGCGTGRLTSKIARLYPYLYCYGVDISAESLKLLKGKGDKNITPVQMDCSNGKLIDHGIRNVHRILSMQMIQHLNKEGAINAITEIYNALDSNGIAVVELYNYGGLCRIMQRIRARGRILKVEDSGLFYEYRYSTKEFVDFVKKYTKFRNIEIYGCQNIPRLIINRSRKIMRADLLLSELEFSKFLGHYFVAVLKK